MSKPLSSQITDQVAHFCVAILIILPVLIFHNFWVGVYAGFACGMVREVTQRGDPVTLTKIKDVITQVDFTGTTLDLLFWTIGGAAAGLLASLA